MLVFFRQKAAIIAITIVSIMVLTLFVGTIFFGGTSQAPTVNPENIVAMVNDIPVTNEQYNEILNQNIRRYRIDPSQKQDPELIELLQYTSFEQALQTSILLHAAEAANVDPKGSDIDAAIQGIVVQYELKDVDQLKDQLTKSGYDWSDFKARVERDVKIQLFANYLQSSVKVTNQDVDNFYTKIHAQQILIRIAPGDRDAEDSALNRANDLFKKLKNGADFASLAKEHSDDLQSKSNGGDLGWIDYGSTVTEFENAMYALETGEISRPVRTPFGFHIIKIIEKNAAVKITLINVETEKTRLLQIKQQNAISNFVRGTVSQSKLIIKDPYLRAYYSKVTGDNRGALDAYQAQQSLNSYDARPHYLASKVYKAMGDTDAELAELKKATLKGSLSPQSDIPIAHVALGRRFGQMGNVASKNEEFDKAIASSKGHLVVMKTVEKAFKDAGETQRAGIVASEILRIEAMIRQANPTANQPAGATSLKL